MAEHRSSDQRTGSRRDDGSESKMATQAMQQEGGTGGVSGTGQAFPHHGFGDEDTGKEALENPVGDEAALPMPETGSTYQAGGTHLNRLRQQETRKDRLSGATVASEGRGGLDPAPGAPVKRG
jgi:hypothetical protein